MKLKHITYGFCIVFALATTFVSAQDEDTCIHEHTQGVSCSVGNKIGNCQPKAENTKELKCKV